MDPIEVMCTTCKAQPNEPCVTPVLHSVRHMRPYLKRGFPAFHRPRERLARVAGRPCPVPACAADVGQPCVHVIGPDSMRGTPKPDVHFRRAHPGAA